MASIIPRCRFWPRCAVAAAAGDAVGPPRLICAAPENCRREGVAVRRWLDATAP